MAHWIRYEKVLLDLITIIYIDSFVFETTYVFLQLIWEQFITPVL